MCSGCTEYEQIRSRENKIHQGTVPTVAINQLEELTSHLLQGASHLAGLEAEVAGGGSFTRAALPSLDGPEQPCPGLQQVWTRGSGQTLVSAKKMRREEVTSIPPLRESSPSCHPSVHRHVRRGHPHLAPPGAAVPQLVGKRLARFDREGARPQRHEETQPKLPSEPG